MEQALQHPWITRDDGLTQEDYQQEMLARRNEIVCNNGTVKPAPAQLSSCSSVLRGKIFLSDAAASQKPAS